MVEAGWSDAQADCRRVFEENSHPMWVVEALEVVDVNRAALLHYGYSRDEFLALTLDDLAAERPPAAKVAQNPRAPWKHRRKDGSFIDVEITSFAVTFRGRPASLDSVLDVTYRRRTEDQTRYLDLLLATVTDAVVASDDKFVLTGWNAAAESTYGRRAEEVLGRPAALVFRTDFVGVATRRGDQPAARNGPLPRRADPPSRRRKAHPHRITRRRPLRQRRQTTRLRQRQPRHHRAQVRRADHPRPA